MPLIAGLTNYYDGQVLTAALLSADFQVVQNTVNGYGAWTDRANTFTPLQTFSAGATLNGPVNISGLATLTGGLTLAGGMLISTGGLTISASGAAITGNVGITGALNVTGALTYGSISVPAASVTAGSFGAGSYTITGTLTAGGLTLSGGQLRGLRATQTGAGGTVSFTNANHVRHTMTGNGTLTLSGGVAGTVYTVEVLQDATGSRTVAWSGVTWASGTTPTSTATANRKDVYTFFYTGSTYLGVAFGQNFASTD